MKKQTISNLKLGLFVLAGTFFLVATLFLLSQQRNLFNSVIRVGAEFSNVSGLVKGNNVRFGGINVGTVERITISSDTTVFVEMAIRKEVSSFIKKTALASVGTDGLMGNAIINLSAVIEPVAPVEEGDVLRSVKAMEISDMMQILGHSGDNLSAITDDLRLFTGRLNQSPTLRRLLTDEALATDLHQTTASLRVAGSQIQSAATDIRQVTGRVRAGRGNIGYLLKDSSLAIDMNRAMGSFRRVGNRADTLVQTLSTFTDRLNTQQGALTTILSDTLFNGRLQSTMGNVEQGTARFDENMKALQSNFLFRRYFRKKKP
jgi:phospholipid/cholesterol/gamma-HCH transport system substrate-binding protein